MTVNRRLVSNDIAERLTDVVTWAAVTVANRDVDPPCIIVDPLQGGTVLRMIDDVETTQQGSLPYQLTCVGVSGTSGREQAEQLATDAIAALVGWSTDVVIRVQVDAWGNVRPDHDRQPPVWIAQPMVRVTARATEE